MSGREHYGFPAFDEAATQLRAEGWAVCSPAEHDRSVGFDPSGPPPDGEMLAAMHKWDFEAISHSDAIYLLAGWEDSDGATRELDVATACGLEILAAPGAASPWIEGVDLSGLAIRIPVDSGRTHWNGTTWVEPPSPEAEATLAEWQRKLDALPPYVPGAKLPVDPPVDPLDHARGAKNTKGSRCPAHGSLCGKDRCCCRSRHDPPWEPPDGEAAEPRIREFPTGAVRDSDADATRYDLISPQAMERLAATYAEGAAKYSDHNFRKGIPYSVMANHALRHIYRWLAGENGEDHLAHAAWGLFGLIEFTETRPELDDRFRWGTQYENPEGKA
jgi:hypothetical protein